MPQNTIWPSIVWTGLIFVLLVIPTEGIPHDGVLGLRHLDKLAHFFLFGVLVWLLSMSNKTDQPRAGFRFFTLSAGYGILMEFIQAGFTKRAFEILDILADLAGAAAAWFLIEQSKQHKK